MAHAKKEHRALSEGGMKFLYAQGNVVAIARFCKEEAFVAVISTGEQEEKIRLPLGVLGKKQPKGEADLLGKKLEWKRLDEKSIEFVAAPHTSYFMECE